MHFITGGLMETQLSEIKMHVHDEIAFAEVIDYLYSSRIAIKESNVQDFLPIAGMLQLKRLQQSCCDFMKRNIDASNCLCKYSHVINTIGFLSAFHPQNFEIW